MNAFTPTEVIEGTIEEPISLRAELVGRSMATIAEFAVSGQEICYFDYDMPRGQQYPIRPDFKQHDFVIIAGVRRSDGRLKALAINIPNLGCVVSGESFHASIVLSFVSLFFLSLLFWFQERFSNAGGGSLLWAFLGFVIAGIFLAPLWSTAYQAVQARNLVKAAADKNTIASAAS